MATPAQAAEQSSDQIEDSPAKWADRTSRSPFGPRRTTSSVVPPEPPPAPAEPMPPEPPEAPDPPEPPEALEPSAAGSPAPPVPPLLPDDDEHEQPEAAVSTYSS